ncbi:MAG: LuxR C-terminal-related transcriptional regulator [Treponema sp.]|jgi:LuxR family maltose regulon positive regulatory protein|nr:LuxR C-terminal-related transcriptional regulator [Treponema sp.]
MESSLQASHDASASFHFERPRLNDLFMEAVKYPLVVVCAGAGYGKTTAVHDFLKRFNAAKAWIQLSERDNVGRRFWENYTHSVLMANVSLSKALSEIGFPDNKEKIRHYKDLIQNYFTDKKRILVIDDFHCIEDRSVLRFMEEGFFRDMLPGTTVFLISRSVSNLNIAGLSYRDQIFNVNESDLHFTENELAQYFRRMDITLRTESLREIMQDTEGWAFAINLIARSYQKAPGYGGYVRTAMKQNIFRLLEMEIWNGLSEPLKNFLVRLSLIDHLSVDLITQLAGKEEKFATELEKQSAYVRLDSYINAYLIHPLFLEFLKTKQTLLTEEQIKETYAVSGDWCASNGFKIDAISYYEKAGNYQSIVSILDGLTAQIPQDIGRFAAPVLDRAPEDAFDNVELLAEMHLRTYLCQGLWQKSLELVKYYEAKFLRLPGDDILRNRTLAQLNVCWSYIRALMSVTDDIFDFEIYMEKANKFASTLKDSGKFDAYYSGAWINFAGSSRKGAPEEFINVVTRIRNSLSHDFLKGSMAGEIELLRGELDFYRGNVNSALPLFNHAVKEARLEKQFGFVHRALFYILRTAVSQGNFAMAEQALKDIKAQFDETSYIHRFMDYDISLSWYYCFLGMPEKTIDWLKEDFSPYIHAAFIENFWNQIKARFFYATRDYAPLLAYIEEMKTRESILYGRVEMLAMEACVHLKMKNREKAFSALREAYENAHPNKIVMPFIEMGKEMRTLTSALLKEPDNNIPKVWLEDVNRKSATYAKRRSHVIAEYAQVNRVSDSVNITPREADILSDLSHGLSRAEIASSRGLSINTIKMVINSLYFKLGAQNLADLIRIATNRKMI